MKSYKNCYYLGERLATGKSGAVSGVELFCILGRYRAEDYYPNSEVCPGYSRREADVPPLEAEGLCPAEKAVEVSSD